jgi:alkylated DNA repair dioxygenase AlkB
MLPFFILQTMNLFSSNPISLNLPNADIVYFPDFYSIKDSHKIFKNLRTEIPWQQDDITVFGKKYQQPRLTSLFGNAGKPYSYSNITMQPHQWTAELLAIKNKVELACKAEFSTVLLNLYRDGKDSNGWHADDEKELGKNPIIASLSFGAERFFYLKHKYDPSLKHKLLLQNGSLLLMQGETQHFWKHQIAKTAKPIQPRINLTFRILK